MNKYEASEDFDETRSFRSLTRILTYLARKPLECLRQQIMGWTAILSHGNVSKEIFTNMTKESLKFKTQI